MIENEFEFEFDLSETEKNMSFTELLKNPQMNEVQVTDLGVGDFTDEPVLTYEVPTNDIDYDENGTDVDDDEVVEARSKHMEANKLETQFNNELARLDEQLHMGKMGCDEDSEYDDESDLDSPKESSDEDEYGYLSAPVLKPRKQKFHKGNDVDGINWNDTTFFVEQTFKNAVEFRNKITDYCARNGIDVKYTRNHKEKIGVKCNTDHCEWRIWASMEKNKRHFQVKTYHGVHSCGRKNRVKNITYKWIARHYLRKFKSNPYMKLQEIIDSVWTEHGLKVSLHMAFRAKKCALNLIVGEYEEQYALLNNYAAEVIRADRNNTVKFQLENNVFRRMYICFAALREGFIAGCRPFISIDGCWLKGPYGGQLLVAVGRDGNNQMYPIAWAVVDVESTESWSWFLLLLAGDLGTSDGAGYTIMSDQQKGLLKAVNDVWPQAEQRVCARHVYMNFREIFGGGLEYRMHFWKIAKSTTPNEFKENIDLLSAICPEAATDLLERNYKKWCRAFYTPQSQCNSVDNNMSGVFNAYILSSRHKPIITMLEDIRESIMERLHKKRDFIRSKDLVICPRAQEQLEKAKIGARGWNSYFGGKFTFGVRDGATQTRYVVDLLNKTCSCNAWQLNGIPCHHTVAAIWHNKERPEAYVAECYKKSYYLKAYDYLMEPLNGAKEWPASQKSPIKAPRLKKVRAGRPKKARRPGPGENSRSKKKSKVGTTCHCSICGLPGHNKSRCKLPQANSARSITQPVRKNKNSKAKSPSSERQPSYSSMHNRGYGMYTYPNGFQRLGNLSTRLGNQSETAETAHLTQYHNHRPNQVKQVAYYSDFEGEQTLRGITIQESVPQNQSQITSTSSNRMSSFIDSSGRNCVTHNTLKGSRDRGFGR